MQGKQGSGRLAMQDHGTHDEGAAARRARFGALPERIAPADLVESKAASPRDPERDGGGLGTRHLLTCLAWDLVL
ncbi:hypothetical protein ACWEQ8_21555 [Streptomyces noursei]